jgi:lysozyme
MNHDLLREMLRRHEGLRLRPYLCPAGRRSIGYGWNMDAHPLPAEIAAYLHLNGEITKTMAERLLTISIDMAERQARDIFPDFAGFSEARQAALVDFVFNCGAGTYLKFRRMLAAIKAGRWDKAADEAYDSDWRKQVGGRAEEIIGMLRVG